MAWLNTSMPSSDPRQSGKICHPQQAMSPIGGVGDSFTGHVLIQPSDSILLTEKAYSEFVKWRCFLRF